MITIECIWKVFVSVYINSVLNLPAVLRLVWLTYTWPWSVRFAPVGDAVKMNSKGFYYILDATANVKACCLRNHLGMPPLVLIRTFVEKKKNILWENNMRRMLRVCRAALRKCFRVSCGACMLDSLPSVLLTHSGFDIAYSYWYVKGCFMELESCWLCLGCGRLQLQGILAWY